MIIKRVKTIYFSPTRTSKRVAEEVALGTRLPMGSPINLTYDSIADDTHQIKDSLIILAAPVYGGRIAPTAVQRIRTIDATNCPCVVIAVYGNRDYDDALLELMDEARMAGMKPMAAAAFVGEHTFSTKEYPIAAGRPDAQDLQKAEAFGRSIVEKLEQLESLADIVLPKVKGNRPYRPYNATPATPETVTERCVQCGHCIEICPTDAIRFENSHVVSDPLKCIKCCACLKECPNEARVFVSPYSAILNKNCSARKEPEIIL